MKTFYGPVPETGDNEVEIAHDLGTENLSSVTVWYLPRDGYGEGITKQLVITEIAVTSPNHIRLIFSGPRKPANGVTYEVGIVAA